MSRVEYLWGAVATNGLQLGVALKDEWTTEKASRKLHVCMINRSKQIIPTPFPCNYKWLGLKILVKNDAKEIAEGINIGNSLNHSNDGFILLHPGEAIYGVIDLSSVKGLSELNLPCGYYSITAIVNYDYAYIYDHEHYNGEETTVVVITRPAFPQYNNIQVVSAQLKVAIGK